MSTETIKRYEASSVQHREFDQTFCACRNNGIRPQRYQPTNTYNENRGEPKVE